MSNFLTSSLFSLSLDLVSGVSYSGDKGELSYSVTFKPYAVIVSVFMPHGSHFTVEYDMSVETDEDKAAWYARNVLGYLHYAGKSSKKLVSFLCNSVILPAPQRINHFNHHTQIARELYNALND